MTAQPIPKYREYHRLIDPTSPHVVQSHVFRGSVKALSFLRNKVSKGTIDARVPALPGIWPGSTAVVIGVGGLGIYAVQFLRLLTGARVVAVDSTEARLKLARQVRSGRRHPEWS